MTRIDGFELGAVDDGFFHDPYPVYRAVRDLAGPCRQPDGSVFVGRYDDVAEILGNHADYSSDKTIDFKPRFGDGSLYEHHTTSLVFNDPPHHTRVRRLLTPFFTPRTLRALEPNVAAMVDELVAATAEKETIDLVADFAIAIPLTLIGDMLGIPRGEREPLRAWATIILGALEPALTAEQLDQGNRAVEDFKAYLKDLIAWKRGRLEERDDTDILSALLADHDTADGLTELELMHNCIFLLNAGHDTTAMMISNGFDLLFRFPDQMARLRADPSLMKTALEEILRYESPLQVGNRRTNSEVTVHGETLAPGTFIHVGIGSANHDERQFPQPDAFDIARRPNRHLAFGNGIHTCAGNSLARMEASLAVSKLLDRFATIEPAGPTVRPPRARFRVVSELPTRLVSH
jgi:cytochrome P450